MLQDAKELLMVRNNMMKKKQPVYPETGMDNGTGLIETAQMIFEFYACISMKNRLNIVDYLERRKGDIMYQINENYQKLPGSYLFSTIAKK